MANPARIELLYIGAGALLLLGACQKSTDGNVDPASSSQRQDAGAWQPLAPPRAGETHAQSGGAGSAAGSSGAAAAGSGAMLAAQGGAGSSAAAGAHASGGAGAEGRAGATAGTLAAGSGGSASLSGASRCDNPDLLVCESFESGVDKATWHTKLSAPTVDDMHAARGSKALHMHTGATSGSGIETDKVFMRAQGHYYGRMFVYFDALPSAPTWAHWTIVGANPVSSSSDQSEIRVGGQLDQKLERWGVGTDHGPSGDWTNLDQDPGGKAQAVPQKRWLCVEWLHDWEHDETRFYVDGEEHPSLHTNADVQHGGNANVKYTLPELGSVWVGFWNYDQGKTVTPAQFDTWIDEVALDDERIGCDK